MITVGMLNLYGGRACNYSGHDRKYGEHLYTVRLGWNWKVQNHIVELVVVRWCGVRPLCWPPIEFTWGGVRGLPVAASLQACSLWKHMLEGSLARHSVRLVLWLAIQFVWLLCHWQWIARSLAVKSQWAPGSISLSVPIEQVSRTRRPGPAVSPK